MTDPWTLATDCSWPDRCDLTARLWAQSEPPREDLADGAQRLAQAQRALFARNDRAARLNPGVVRRRAELWEEIAAELHWWSADDSGAYPERRFPWSAKVAAIRERAAAARRHNEAEACRLAEAIHDFFWDQLHFYDPLHDDYEAVKHDHRAIMNARDQWRAQQRQQAA